MDMFSLKQGYLLLAYLALTSHENLSPVRTPGTGREGYEDSLMGVKSQSIEYQRMWLQNGELKALTLGSSHLAVGGWGRLEYRSTAFTSGNYFGSFAMFYLKSVVEKQNFVQI